MTRRTSGVWIAAVVAVGALLLLPSLAAGGKGNGGGGGPQTGSTRYTVTISPSVPYRFGQAIYVTTDTPMYANGDGPYIWLRCSQGGTEVLATDHAGFPTGWYYGDPFYLGPTQMWTSGAADCTVSVVHRARNKFILDAQQSFHVDP